MRATSSNSNNIKQSEQAQSTPLLLKPTGVPVFVPIEHVNKHETLKLHSQQSTLDSLKADEMQRTVKAQSFVIGKKIQNSTGLNLIDQEQNLQEKQFPVKVIYQKPSFKQRAEFKVDTDPSNIENVPSNILKPQLKKDFPKTNAVSDGTKITESKYRPKSATTQQLKKDQVQRTKLGTNITKPQISYIKKAAIRPKTADANTKSQPKKKEVKQESPPKPQVEIPFAQNRYQGKNITKDLFKKAQELLKEQKELDEKLKLDQQQKKESEKKLQEEIRKKNQDYVQQQKEKGAAEHIDFRKKEEEEKDRQRRVENKQERDKRVELREKRKNEGRKGLGLDIFDEQKLQEHLKKKKDEKEALIKQFKPEKSLPQQVKINKVDGAIQLNKKPIQFNNKNIQEIIEEDEVKEQIDKKQLLIDQKKKRKLEIQEKLRQENEEKLKKVKNMEQLDEVFRQQKEDFKKRKELEKKIKEERERLRMMEAKLEKKQRKNKSMGQNEFHKEKIDELKSWINDQMDKQDEESKQVNNDLDISNNQIEEQPQFKVRFDVKEKQQEINIPGNNKLSEKEESKLGSRQNRYGAFGDNGYQQIVEIKRNKLADEKPTIQQQQQQVNEQGKNKIKEHLKEKLIQVSNKVDVTIVDNQPKTEQKQAESEEDKMTRILEKSIKNETIRKLLIESQKKQKEQVKQQDLPGVVNVQSQLNKQKQEQQAKELAATKVIQKWAKGFLARQLVKQIIFQKKKQIDDAYEYFESQVKFNQDYNLNKFLQDKKKLRDMNQLNVIASSDSIKEDIIDSTLVKQQQNLQQEIKNKINTKVQNYFSSAPTDKDPLSLIALFAKRNVAIVDTVKQSINNKVNLSHRRRTSQSSEIVEDIYSEKFDEEEKVHRVTADDEIDEDIVEGSKETVSSGNKFKKQQKSPFNYKQSMSESIAEDYVMSAGKSSTAKKSKNEADDDIVEESYLGMMSGSKSSEKLFVKRQNHQQSIIEEDIGSYQKEDFESYDHSNSVKKQVQQQQIQFQEQMKQNEVKRKETMNEFLKELKNYDQVNVQTEMVEKIESIISKSQHQKDKLIFASKLHELELEKKYKDEINQLKDQQIKMMALMMMKNNNNNSNDQDQQQLMENLEKLLAKPAQVQPEIKKQSQSKQRDEELESIIESIRKDSDDIEEESMPEHQDESSQDEIKESVYVDGAKSNNDGGLSKLRMAFGSEETIRKQSKKTLESSQQEKKKQSIKEDQGLFDKHAFEEFSYKKFKELLFDEKAVNNFLTQVEDSIQEKEKSKKAQLQKDLNVKLISPRTYKKQELELEKWVDNERKQLNMKKKKVVEYVEMSKQLNNIASDKQDMIRKLGSPRPNRNNLLHSQNSNNYESSMSQIDMDEEESSESIRVREARNQMRKIHRDLNTVTEQEKSVQKKKAAAKKLLLEKEKAIAEGIKEKLMEIEAEHADEMLNAALGLDIDEEIRRRIAGARRSVEESRGESENMYESSARSVDIKKKKKVQFESPPNNYESSIEQSQQQYQNSSVNESSVASSKHTSLHQLQQQKNTKTINIQDSIDESLQIDESLSQSLPQQIQESKKSTLNSGLIKESIQEEDYSQNFIEESRNTQQNNQLSGSKDSRYYQMKKHHEASQSDKYSSNNKKQESEEEDEIGYSMNFDEEGSLAKMPPVSQDQQQAELKTKIDVVKEESESEQSRYLKGSIDDYAVEDDMVEASAGTVLSNSRQNIQVESIDVQESYDKEVLQSVQSIEWQINLESSVQQHSNRQQTEDLDKYSEDFDNDTQQNNEDEDMDNLQDLESCPDDIGGASQSLNNNEFSEKQIDMITDEFMDIIMNNIQNDISIIKNLEKADIDQFKDKFPFSAEEELRLQEEERQRKKQEEAKLMQKSLPQKRDNKTQEEVVKERYEAATKSISQVQTQFELYLDLMIKNIDRKELIKQLEKPIENDPLKILQRIQAVEAEESQSMNNLNESLIGKQQFVLSLEQFKHIENLYKVIYSEKVNISESTEQKKLMCENYHHKAIFDAFNQALDVERPYKMKGQPNPWSKQTRQIRQSLTQQEAENILSKAKSKVIEWAKTNAGTRCSPLPPPPQINEYDHAPQQPTSTEEERRNAVREEKLSELLSMEINGFDQLWTDYENEDTQVKFDLADMILSDLANEIATFLNSKIQQ